MEMTSCLFRKDVPRPRSVSARCWDAQGGKTRSRPVAGSLLLGYTLRHPPHLPLTHTHSANHASHTHSTSHTQVSTYATPCHMHARTDTNAHATHTTIFLPNISHRRISTHATMKAHTYTTGSELHKYPETYTDVYNHFLSPYRWPHSTRTLR